MAKEEVFLDSFLGDRSRLEGTLSFSGTLTMLGKFKGRIKGGETVILGSTSESDADVEADVVSVHGKVTGSIAAGRKVEIHEEAEVEADVSAPTFVIHEGALFEGQCSMKEKRGIQGGKRIVELKEGWLRRD